MFKLSQNNFPSGLGGRSGEQTIKKISIIGLSAAVADHALNLARHDIEGCDQGLSSVSLIFEFTSLDLAGCHRQRRSDALKGLDPVISSIDITRTGTEGAASAVFACAAALR